METDNKDIMPEDNWAEKQVERYFCKKMEELGCQTYKFVSPGCVGVPDRIVIMPGGMTWFVELKRKGGKLSAAQWVMLKRLYKVTANLKVLSGKEDVDNFYERIGKGIEQYWVLREAQEKKWEDEEKRKLMEQD